MSPRQFQIDHRLAQGPLATFERHLIKARTDQGRKRALKRGVRFGWPRKRNQDRRQEALRRLVNGKTLVDVARTFAVDPTTTERPKVTKHF